MDALLILLLVLAIIAFGFGFALKWLFILAVVFLIIAAVRYFAGGSRYSNRW